LYLRESDTPDAESSLLRNNQKQLIAEAIEQLPVEFREVMVLRELEEQV
jgi:DNA-directed RNA polymerase specialized sigma24 family protein